MYAAVGEDVARLIAGYGLHAGQGPVQLDRLLADLFVVVDAALMAHGVLGLAQPPVHCLPLSPQAKGGILVDEHLTPAERRIVLAHEIGHVVCMHIGSLNALATGPSALDDQQEREAWQVAAALLVPVREVWSGDPPAEIAARNGVPVELVTHHPWRPERWLAEARGEEGAWWRRLVMEARPFALALALLLVSAFCFAQGVGLLDLDLPF